MSEMPQETLTLPEPLRLVLREYDVQTNDFYEDQLGFALKGRFGECGEISEPQRKACFAEIAAFQFSDTLARAKNPWETRFGPIITGTLEDDTPYCFPDISEVDQAIIQYWTQRANDAQHPVLKARYADLAWDLAKAATDGRPSIQMARQAIDSYIECDCRSSYTHRVKCRLERALELALASCCL